MDTRIAVLTILSFVIAAVVRAAKEDLPRLKTFSPASRAIFVASVSIVGAGVDGALANRVDFPQALLAAFMLGGPGLVMMIIEWLGGGSPPAGGASGGDAAPLRGQKGPYSAALSAFGLALALVALPGCTSAQLHAVTPILNTVVTDVQDAEQVLNVVRSVVDIFFLEHASPDARAKVTKAMADAQLALTTAEQATNGVANLTQGREDEAFAGFKVAFDSLVKLLGDLGIADTAGKVAAPHGGGRVAIPVPVVISRARS